MEINEQHTVHEHASTSMKVVLLVFAIAVVAALGYFVYNDWKTPWDDGTSDNAVKKSTSATKDWKTYTNSTLGYSIKYPANWTTKDITSTMTGYTSYVGLRPTTQTDDYAMVIEVYTADRTVAEAIARIKQGFADNSSFLTQAQVTLNKTTWTKLSFRNNTDATILPIRYIALNGTNVVVMSGPGSSGVAATDTLITTINNNLTFATFAQ